LAAALNTSATENSHSYTQCIKEMIADSSNAVTTGEIKKTCRTKTEQSQVSNENIVPIDTAVIRGTLLEQRLESEKVARDSKFLLIMHRPNYILMFAHNDKTNEAPFALQFPTEDTSLDKYRSKISD